MPRIGPEFEDVQQPAIALLRDHFGYRYVPAEELGDVRSSESEVVLTDVLAEKLREINPGITDNGIRDTIDALRQPLVQNLIEANEACHLHLSRWVTITEFRDGRPANPSIRLFDFESPEKNDFLIVDELLVKGPRKTRRLDLVVFVNGIPLVVMECKNPGDREGITQAIQDLLDYQDTDDGVARLFHTALLTIALQRHDARYGTIATPMQRYAEWKSVFPKSKFDLERMLDRDPTPQDMLLSGMLSPENLIDLLRNFVVFDRDEGRVVKKLARYQQFEAVNLTIRRVTKRESDAPQRERGGVIWHTQGSGKSLTMLWLALKLRRHPKLENPTLLIVTDRTDLDRQITETFINCKFENPERASRFGHLRKMLRGPGGRTIMTTVQKFREEIIPDTKERIPHPVLSTDPNFFVLIDEAHRTEYGQFNANLRQALPNAVLLGFTGTPIPKTLVHFGSYIHTYKMPQSVADGATVPILYESRMAEMEVWGNRIDPEFDDEFRELSQEQKSRLKSKLIKFGEVESRIVAICKDIAAHYRENFERDGFKAQVAVCSQKAAEIYHRELEDRLGDRVAVLISGTQDKKSPLNDLRDRYQPEEQWIEKLKTGSVNDLAMIVVVDKYLTGFDAPIVRVLYLDKPLVDHNLLQAIARVNRPMPEKGKEWGLIVDYWGVAKYLDKALASLSQDIQSDEVMRKRRGEASFERLKQCRTSAFALFPDELERNDIEPWLLALEKEDIRAIFMARFREFYKSLEQVLPDKRALPFIDDFRWLKRVRSEAVVMYQQTEDSLPSAFSQRVNQIVNANLRSKGVAVLLEPVSVLDDKFAAEVDKLKSSRAKASRMEHALKRTITVNLHQDPVFYSSLQRRVEEIVEDHRLARIDDLEQLQLFSSVRDTLREGQSESAETLGLEQEAYAVYGFLDRRYGESGEDVSQQELVELAESIFEVLQQEAVLDWTDKEDVQREMRRKVKRQLRLAKCPKVQIEPITSEIMDWARTQLKR